MLQALIEQIDTIRRQANFLTIAEVLQLTKRKNILLDPFSLLISKDVVLGSNNVFYPNVVLQTGDKGKLTIQDSNAFFPNTLFLAKQGTIHVGDGNQFGDGGCSIKSNGEKTKIIIGDQGRYINGPTIVGNTILGNGSQVLGSITVQDCILDGGGSFETSEPDQRGAVLKGMGLARNITLKQGEVIQAYGTFTQAIIRLQSYYHPKEK